MWTTLIIRPIYVGFQSVNDYCALNHAPFIASRFNKSRINLQAVAVKELISPSKRIILVASAYHMYRAKRLFEKQGFIVIPYKVDSKASRNNTTTFMDFLSTSGNLELTEIEIREIIGRICYLIKG